MIKVVVIEDSRLARVELKALLQEHPQLTVVAEADTVNKAIEVVNALAPDLIFLDIHLPGGTGFDVLSNLQVLPMVIFTTAFDAYALESFEYHTIDYLLKPIVPAKLDRAIQKLEVFLQKETKAAPMPRLGLSDKIFIKDRNSSWLVEVGDIRMCESKGNYTQVFFHQHRPLLQKSLQQVAGSLKDGLFIKANRKQLVGIKWIERIGKNPQGRLVVELSSGEEVLVSRRQMSRLKSVYSIPAENH